MPCRRTVARGPVSRVLSRARYPRQSLGGTGRAGAAIHLGSGLLQSSSSQPGRSMRNTSAAAPEDSGAPPLFGLAPGGVCHAGRVAEAPVRSYRTLSPLPGPASRPSAVCSLWHFPSAAIRGQRPGGRYPPPLFRGARTFLVPCGTRLPGPLAVRAIGQTGCGAKPAIGPCPFALVRHIGRAGFFAPPPPPIIRFP